MKYGRRYSFKFTPWLVRQIVAILLLVFVIGGVAGYGICSISASDNETPEESTSIVELAHVTTETTEPTTYETTESTTVEVTEPTTTEVTEPAYIYYDVPLSHGLQDYIREICERHDIPMSLIIAMIDVESSFRAMVISESNDYGLMQINEINHADMSDRYGVTNFLDPYENVFCGISHISELYYTYHDWGMALMAYNLGSGGAKSYWDEGIYETSYSRQVLSTMEVYDAEI
jgi:hypothetical protein